MVSLSRRRNATVDTHLKAKAGLKKISFSRKKSEIPPDSYA
jgi:hypothetical protein